MKVAKLRIGLFLITGVLLSFGTSPSYSGENPWDSDDSEVIKCDTTSGGCGGGLGFSQSTDDVDRGGLGLRRISLRIGFGLLKGYYYVTDRIVDSARQRIDRAEKRGAKGVELLPKRR